MFSDKVRIFIKSGKGGDGHVSFRRELYVQLEVRMVVMAAMVATSYSRLIKVLIHLATSDITVNI